MVDDKIKALEKRLAKLGDKGKEGKEKVEALNELAKAFTRSEPVKAEEYARQALALAEKLNYKEGIAASYQSLGVSSRVQGNYRQALGYCSKALNISKEMGNKKGVANSHGNIGNIHAQQGDCKQALTHLLNALRVFEELGDKTAIASAYNSIGNVYGILGDRDRVLEYYLKTLSIREEIGNKVGIAISYGNVGLIYKELGDYDKALAYQLKALKLREELADSWGVAISYGNMGTIYEALLDYDKALSYLQGSLEILEKTADKNHITDACLHIGSIYIQQRRFDSAQEYLMRSLELSREIGARQKEMASCRRLSQLFDVQGNFKEALHYHKKYSELREKIFSDESAAKIAQIQIKYETEQKEWEAEFYRLKTEDLEAEITERKRAQKALLKAKEDWERTFDAVPDLITIMDGRFRIVRANKAMADRLGITPEECRGQTCFERIHGTNKSPSFCPHARLLKDGQEHIEEVYEERLGGDFLVTVSPLFDSQKQVIGSVHVARDITERKRVQQALAESEERYRTLQENIPVGIFRTSPQGEFLSANRALVNMLGFKSDKEMVNVSVADVYVFPEHRQEYVKLMNEEGMVVNFEAQLRRKDGSVFWGSVNARAVLGKEGQVVHYDGILEDITERKRVSEQIKAALREKEVLLKEIHHRVKNNLQVVESLLSLQAEHLKDEKALAIFKNSQSRIASMALVHEKLYQSEDLARIDFGAYIRDLTNSLFTSYALAPGTVTLGMDIEDVALDIDTSIPLALIINELVTNSLLHAFPQGRKGQIRIGLHADDGNDLTLVFTDDGVGLPEAIDIHNTETLGLQLVSLLVKQLRGNIELDRSNGTRFNIRFVRIEEEP
jgi:PAS domain S-box-containing protein